MTMALLQHLLSHPVDVEGAFEALHSGDSHAVWFDDHGERGRGVSYLASGHSLSFTPEEWPNELRAAHQRFALDHGVTVGPIPLGLVVMFPYELALAGAGVAPWAMQVDRVVAIDHASGHVTLYALGPAWSPDLEQWRDRVSALLAEQPLSSAEALPQGLPLTWRDTQKRYRDMIHAAKEAIAQGNAYQLCVTTQVSISGAVDPLALHRHMRRNNPTHHQALLRWGDITVVSASPETFLELSVTGLLTTRPIKGTRPRGATEQEDQLLAAELEADDKERAENLMIVDLMRNDLSQVCEVGSVEVPELLVVETYSSVHQLVSTVTGQIRRGLDLVDVVTHAFPAGSMTGAPKQSAREILAGLENAPRGIYAGAFGVWRADHSATLAMTIRTAIVYPDHLTLGVGGGITALSEPDSEIAEVGIKAASFLSALGHTQLQYS